MQKKKNYINLLIENKHYKIPKDFNCFKNKQSRHDVYLIRRGEIYLLAMAL